MRFSTVSRPNRSVDLSRACKLQHSKYMSTCVSDDHSRRRENETTASYNNRRFEGRAGSGLHGSLYWDSACFFFRLALKINARGGRETEKLIIVPLHNHCLCRVGPTCLVAYLARSIDPDVRNLTGMQQSSSFLFCSFFVCFLTKEEQRLDRTCTRSWNWSAESKVYCRAGAALHCRSRLFARESSKYLLFVEAKVESSTSK